MITPTKDDWEKHCKDCIHNQKDHWCDEFNCNPYHALIFCGEDDFNAKEEKEGD